MDYTVRLVVENELNPMVFVPLFRVEIKFGVNFLFHHFLYFLIDVVWNLFVLLVELQVDD